MPTLIKIDRTTVRRNPNAGNTTTLVAGMKYVADDGTICQHVREYGHEPEPAMFYEYIPTDVTCCKCEATFKHTALNSNSDCYGETWSDTICPLCGKFDCCEIEYETL